MENEQLDPNAATIQAAADAPVDDVSPSAEDAPDWAAIAQAAQAQVAALEGQLNPLQQQVTQLTQFQQQAMLEKANAAFQQEEREFFQRIEGLDDESARRATQEFYRNQSNREVQALQDMARTIAINGFADKLIQDMGLKPEDRLILGENPDLMPMIAGNLAEQRRNTAQLQAELDRRRTAEQAMNFVSNPATRSAGGQGAVAAAAANYEPGSLEHMKAALGLA